MRRAILVVPRAKWTPSDAEGSITLDHDHRHRRRIVLTTDQGEAVLLDLAEATQIRDGDGLRLEDGATLRVIAAPEPLLEIHAHDEGELLRIAYHLGNRHLAVQLLAERIRIRPDHVIQDMVERLGGHVEAIEAPFDPEGGAYGGGHALHGHEHGHEHGHDHAHPHRHG